MFYLVQWASSKEISVVEESDVVKRRKDFSVISWKGKNYKAKILAVNGK